MIPYSYGVLLWHNYGVVLIFNPTNAHNQHNTNRYRSSQVASIIQQKDITWHDKTSLMPTQQKVSTCQTRSIQVPFLWIYPDPGVCIYALNLLNHSFICIVLVFLWWLNNVWKLISFADWKRLKEGERVALGHFHERVGESPRREKNFGTSGSKKSCFVSEVWPFEVGIGVRPNST